MKSITGVKKTAFLLAGLCTFLFTKSTAQPSYPTSPYEAEVIYTDLEHFVEAYNALRTDADTLKVLQELYFDRGSAGLKEFVNRHQLTPELVKDAIGKYPNRYALIPGFLTNIGEIENSYGELMAAFGEVLPNAMYAPTYLLVGANRGIGQASVVGQLVTVTRVADNMDKLKKLVVHELSHFQQAMAMGGQKYAALYTTPNNMLGLCLREGGAEFVTSLVLRDITQSEALAYIEQDERRLKQQFMADMEAQNKDFWMWASLNQHTHPKLLGYAMGYKICHSYYAKAQDKTMALQDILRMDDADVFAEASGYFNSK